MMLSQVQKQKIKSIFVGKKVILFLLFLVVFSGINAYFNEWFEVGFAFLNYDPFIKYSYMIFTPLNAVLVAMSMSLLVQKIKEIRQLNPTGSILGLIGTVTALLTGACPGCIVGVFPFVMGLFGSHFALWGLPFHGVELQALSFVLLLIGIYFLSRDMTCKIKRSANERKTKSSY